MSMSSPNEKDYSSSKKSSTDLAIAHKEDNHASGSSGTRHQMNLQAADMNDVAQMQALTRKLENPLYDISKEDLIRKAEEFADKHGMSEDKEWFVKGALLAQKPRDYQDLPELDDEDRRVVEEESTHRWKQPFDMYFLAVACGMAAVVQGMDETVVSGAQLYYLPEFGIKNNDWITGLVNGAPYLCCAVLGCWLTEPMNRFLGRRGTIFLSCTIAALASIWEAFTYSWPQLFVARFILGLGIGPKSATVPVYTAESAPANIRGALVMQWQMWTAFGIMLGNVVDVIFLDVRATLAWRLMLGSTVVAPIIVCCQVYFCPESPRWYMKKGRINKAYGSLLRLRNTKLQAARDCFYMAVAIEIEEEASKGRNPYVDIIRVPRIRRAALASEIVMFMQQFCGINVIAYYSSTIFVQAGFSIKSGILAAMGTGIVNFLFAIPALYTIDTFGRRNLLLTTFPLMAICLLATGLCFLIPSTSKAHIGLIALFIYLFEAVYSPGEGPVPFTYSAEVYPLQVREIGMSLATATTWTFNFVLSLTWPALLRTFGPTGAFCYYSGWNVVGFCLIFLFVPESKGYTLEELDRVFAIPTKTFAKYQIEHIPYYIKSIFLRRKMPAKRTLYEESGAFGENPKPKQVEDQSPVRNEKGEERWKEAV